MTDDEYTVNKKRNIYYNCISDDCNNNLLIKKKQLFLLNDKNEQKINQFLIFINFFNFSCSTGNVLQRFCICRKLLNPN